MNFYSQVASELDSFFNTTIPVAVINKDGLNKFNTRPIQGFSQFETINKIDFYFSSKFLTGDRDAENQKKVFLNIGNFIVEVARKNIDVDLKDIVFIPETDNDRLGSVLLAKDFRVWAKNSEFSTLLNEIVDDLPKYGSVVVKAVGKGLKRVPIQTIRLQQDACSIEEADWFIEEHQYTYPQLLRNAEQLGWNITDIKPYEGRKPFYERYGYVKEKDYYTQKGEKGGGDKMIQCMSISHHAPVEGKKGEYDGNILFIEKIVERPYYEFHWDKLDNRWLGYGEWEKQFENQVMRNFIENSRRRSILWSSKKVFQSSSDVAQGSLVTDVKDGEVVKIEQGGEIGQIDFSTRALADFNAATGVWAENTTQKSFTFEVATGESMPSRTPFKLGAVLSSAVMAHYERKKEKLGIELTKIIVDCVIPKFLSDTSDEHILKLSNGDTGVEILKEFIARERANKTYYDLVFSKLILPDYEQVYQQELDNINSEKIVFAKVVKNFYKDINYHVTVEVTGESINTESKLTTYTSLLQTIAPNPAMLNVPEVRQILSALLSQTGDSLESVIGPKSKEVAQAPQQVTGTPPAAPALAQ